MDEVIFSIKPYYKDSKLPNAYQVTLEDDGFRDVITIRNINSVLNHFLDYKGTGVALILDSFNSSFRDENHRKSLIQIIACVNLSIKPSEKPIEKKELNDIPPNDGFLRRLSRDFLP